MKSKQQKRTEAELRNEQYRKLTPAQQLELLNNHNLRALRQRARLATMAGRKKTA